MEILPGIHQIDAGVGNRFVFQYLFVDDRIVVADSGAKDLPEQAILPYISVMGRPFSDIWMLVVGHGDADHFGGNFAIRKGNPGVTIACHRGDLPWIQSRGRALAERYNQLGLHGIAYPQEIRDFIDGMMGPDTHVDLVLSGGETLNLGDREIEIVHIPGHTPGHIALYDRRNRAAFAGDGAQGRGYRDTEGNIVIPGMYNDPDVYLNTIRILEELDLEHLFLSHYLPMEGSEIAAFFKETRDFVRKTEDTAVSILKRHGKPLTLKEIWTEADPLLGSFGSNWVELPVAIKAHLDKLRRGGELVQGEKNGFPCWSMA